jgi:prepilin-type N-terminal cleavage/methylation domain-containing protein/prepilin-type processing-associated H-X9-DG protein
MKTRKGFTLIELLIVIAVIAILLTLLAPALHQAREQVKRTICSTNLHSIGVSMFMYADESKGKLPENDDPGHPYTAYRGDKDYASHPTGRTPFKLGLIYETKIMNDPKVFYCPSNMLDWLKYESYNSPAPWGSLPQNYNTLGGRNNWVRTGYNYYPQSKLKDSDRLPLVALKRVTLDKDRSMVTDVIWDFENLSHQVSGKPRGLNALFGDGHVTYCNNERAFDPSLWQDTVRPGSIEFRTILDLLEP